MNILFIYSLQDFLTAAKPLQVQEQIQFGISYISSFLKKHGHYTKLIVLTRETKSSIIDKYLKKFNVKLICFSSIFSEYKFIANIAKYIKNLYPSIFLLAGGTHVSLNPEDCVLDSFDALCIGEGEEATLNLVEQLQKGIKPSGIPNLWIKNCLEIEKCSPRPFLQDLDNLPFPDREMWQEWIRFPKSRLPVLLGRGCPFQCTYCCNHALKKLASGNYVRFRSPDNILSEVRELTNTFPGQKEIYLEVESFGVNLNWAIELCSKIENFNAERSQPIVLGVNLRITPNTNLEGLFDAMKKSNFNFINIGVESGSERVRREILKRNYTNEDIIKAVKLARKYNLKVYFFNLIGIPGENISDFMETVKINRICLPDSHYLSIFFPYPGTDLYLLSKEHKIIDEHLDTEMERSKATLCLPGFSKRQIQKSFTWFDYYVYKGHKPLYKIFKRIFVSKIKSNYYMTRFYRRLTNNTFFQWLKYKLRTELW